jgi:hypothetical protein
MAYWHGTPGLREAIWSVAIESPVPGWEIAGDCLRAYHVRGHAGAA